MPEFEVGRLNTSRAVMLFVRAPRIRSIKTTDIEEWIKFFEEKSQTRKKKKVQKYKNCMRFLQYAHDIGGKNTKVLSVYSMPCRGGNRLSFVFEFSNVAEKGEFMKGLSNLEDELSYTT